MAQWIAPMLAYPASEKKLARRKTYLKEEKADGLRLDLYCEAPGVVVPYTRSGKTEPYRKNLAPYNTVVRQLAAELKTPAIDLPKMMRSGKVALEDICSDDRLHLSPAGNHIYAELVCRRLKEIL